MSLEPRDFIDGHLRGLDDPWAFTAGYITTGGGRHINAEAGLTAPEHTARTLLWLAIVIPALLTQAYQAAADRPHITLPLLAGLSSIGLAVCTLIRLRLLWRQYRNDTRKHRRRVGSALRAALFTVLGAILAPACVGLWIYTALHTANADSANIVNLLIFANVTGYLTLYLSEYVLRYRLRLLYRAPATPENTNGIPAEVNAVHNDEHGGYVPEDFDPADLASKPYNPYNDTECMRAYQRRLKRSSGFKAWRESIK